MIDFLDELGNFQQKNFYNSKCKFFYILQQHTQKVGSVLVPTMLEVGCGLFKAKQKQPMPWHGGTG